MKNNRGAAISKTLQSPESQRRLALAQRGVWASYTPAQRKARIEAMTRAINNPAILRKKSLATKRAFKNPEAKHRLIQGIRNSITPEKIKRLSAIARKCWAKPEIRAKHLVHGNTFKGGAGRKPVKFVRHLSRLLLPAGYVMEFSIKDDSVKRTSRGTWPGKKVMFHVVDFALPSAKVVIECDGPHHNSTLQKQSDERRDKALHRLGWKVIRVKHD